MGNGMNTEHVGTEADCQDGRDGRETAYPGRRNVLTRREEMALSIAKEVVRNDRLLRRLKYDTRNVAAFAVDVTDCLLVELYDRGRK